MGWPLQELYERPYLDFVHPDARAKVAAFADQLAHMPPGQSLQVETRARRRDGVYRWLRCSAAVAGGPEPMVYLSGTDTTDLHEYNEIHKTPTRPISSRSVGRWREELSADEVATFWRLAGAELAGLGYART